MKRNMRTFCLFISFLLPALIQGKEKKDTLYSAYGDKVFITYEVTNYDNLISIDFKSVRLALDNYHRGKYKPLDFVKVLFFDRAGGYKDIRFSGVPTESMRIPSGIKYNSSYEGYYILSDQDEQLRFEITSEIPETIDIPIYLAFYKKISNYIVFSDCGTLKIPLKRNQQRSASKYETKRVSQTITSTEEVEPGITKNEEAQLRIKSVLKTLSNEEMTEEDIEDLKSEVERLEALKYEISDKVIRDEIEKTVDIYKGKRRALAEKVHAEERDAQEKAEHLAKKAEQDAIARQDSIAAAARLEADKEKRRNLWLIIGGVLLAVVGFAGNQFFQHIRNVKNQKSIMEMQNSVVKRAEKEAQRRARSMARNQVDNIKNEARVKSRLIVKEGVSKIEKGTGKNKNGISI